MGKDRQAAILGAVLGHAVGNALGATLTGAKKGSVKNAYKKVTDYVDPEKYLGKEKIYKWRKPGLYTVDVQQSLALIDTIVISKGFNPEVFAEKLVLLSKGAEFRFGVYRGADRRFETAVTNLKQKMKASEALTECDGNTAAVRSYPLGLYYPHDENKLMKASIEASILTSRNPVSVSAAAAVAFLTSRFMDMDEPHADIKESILAAADFCVRCESELKKEYLNSHDEKIDNIHIFSDCLKSLYTVFDQDFEEVTAHISEKAGSYSDSPVTRPTMSFAPASVIFSIYLAIKNGADFENAVTTAVNEGGDADGTAAITGALSGALNGIDAIPERWPAGLANRKQIKARAEALASGKWLKDRLDDLYEMEYGLTRREHEERLARMKKLGAIFPSAATPDKKQTSKKTPDKFDRKKFKKERERFEKMGFFTPPEYD